MGNWMDIALGLVAITLLLAFFSYSDKVGHDDHPPEEPEGLADPQTMNEDEPTK